MKSILLIGFALLTSCCGLQAEKNILFIAGKHSHGGGEHEFPEGCALLARALNESGLDLKAEVSQGWPTDPARISQADSIVLYSDGLEDHVAKGHVEELQEHMKSGKGLAVMHFALEPADPEMRKFFSDAIGGSFEVDWSVNPVWVLQNPVLTQHPVTNGVEVQGVKDEWYYHLRFRDGIQPILQANPSPDSLSPTDGPRSGNPAVRQDLAGHVPQTLAWVVENSDGSRGFGFTGGHFHSNWGLEGFRRLALNGIAWTAGVTLPQGGVVSQVAPIPRFRSIDKAIAQGEVEDVRQALIANPDSLNTGEKPGTPPLHQAILRNKTEIAIFLIDAGANLNQVDSSKRTPLHLAVERKNAELVRKLLKKKADPGLRDNDGWTPLHHAAAKNLYDIGVILLDGGADGMALSARGGTALHEAAASADKPFIELLLNRGVDPAVVSLNGDTALSVAKQFHNEAAVEILSKRIAENEHVASRKRAVLIAGATLIFLLGAWIVFRRFRR